jgi:hypothetical protein
MPRYRKRKQETGFVSKAYPGENASMGDYALLLSRMNRAQFGSLQELARHFLGEKTPYRGVVPVNPPKKVLLGAWSDILNADSGMELNQGIYNEHKSHREDPHFEKGGGLLTGAESLLSTAWNYASSFVEPLGWVNDAWDWWSGHQSVDQLPDSIKSQVDLITEAFKKPADRTQVLGDLHLDREMSTDRTAIYKNDQTMDLFCVTRGTETSELTSDAAADASIFITGKPTENDVQATLLDASKNYGAEYELHSVAYSLGASQVALAFYDGNQDPEKKAALDEFDTITLISPGGQPFASDDVPQTVLSDPRFNLLANRSDIISQDFIQNSQHNDHVWYGNGSWHPTYAHSYLQYGSDPPDYEDDKPGMSMDSMIENAQKQD